MSKRKEKFNKLASGGLDINPAEAMHLGIKESGDRAFVALKYFDPQYQCFSCWGQDELKAFTKFIGKLNQSDWQSIFASGGKSGSKTGLGYTPHKNRKKLPQSEVIDRISDDVTFFELRVSQRARVHGFRVKSTFFLVLLDRGHDVYAM